MSKEAMKLARQIIWRYRHETPLGNQPHMIAHEADEAIERIDQALAKQEQGEPVAWMYPDALCDRNCLYLCTKGFTQFPECATTPQQRTWVGLTDGDIEEIWGEDLRVVYSGNIEATKAIEAKLREKNSL